MTASEGARPDAGPILIALGANMPSPVHGAPARTLLAAIDCLQVAGIRVLRRSRLYRSAPVPAADQPWFANAVVRVATALSPTELMGRLHWIEADFGRVRAEPNAPRTLDLDLIAYGTRVTTEGAEAESPVLPHPRLAERAFVLRPLAEVAPDWRHPATGERIAELLARLPAGADIGVVRWPPRRR
ncbi:MAG: 2-amino-4-hydroxy-6-hydroxymethyldihydropteridine diphosphokinase [Alphaproteobacteria bacterium]|nr:2-amino-4-hydroxy-6-hydroxymethyldihydropteridine diphosphokinase [Alphaproteobacteria bacterium]